MPVDAVAEITAVIIAYIVGQGFADMGKHARVVTVKAPVNQPTTTAKRRQPRYDDD
jgi:hypothetical protein